MMRMRSAARFARESVGSRALEQLKAALIAADHSDAAGSTHTFYHYPARFSSAIARAVVEAFSKPGDWILDPFMGGGTAIVEAVSLDRKVIGVDINALAHFVSDVRTTPLSTSDEDGVRQWAMNVSTAQPRGDRDAVRGQRVKNLPGATRAFIGGALERSRELRRRRQRAFARCALLRLGQWALDCRDFVSPQPRLLAVKLPELTEQMLEGLRQFVVQCGASGVSKREIARRRLLLHRSAVGLDQDPRLTDLDKRPRLVFTSPPYPSVHVLYHRWQYRGRRETGAPYWIANVPDGYPESYYTGGSRTPTGRQRYFNMIESAYRSIRGAMDPRGIVVQLVGFADASTQLPRFLDAMSKAGFEEVFISQGDATRLGRRVPNRKWYAKLQGAVDASSELLLLHRPRR